MTELETLERHLAYSAARSDIECYCGFISDRWRDPSSAHADDRETVAKALRYLELRGLIERHPTQPWVRVREEDAPLALDAVKVAA